MIEAREQLATTDPGQIDYEQHGPRVLSLLAERGVGMVKGDRNTGKSNFIGQLAMQAPDVLGKAVHFIDGNKSMSPKTLRRGVRHIDAFLDEYGPSGLVIVDHFDNFLRGSGRNWALNEGKHSTLRLLLPLIERSENDAAMLCVVSDGQKLTCYDEVQTPEDLRGIPDLLSSHTYDISTGSLPGTESFFSRSDIRHEMRIAYFRLQAQVLGFSQSTR